MKKILSMLCAMLVVVSCNKESEEFVPQMTDEGAMRMNLSVASTDLANETISIKVYKVDDAGERQLVRRYTSINDVPEYLALLADDYVAVVTVGERSVASFDNKCYYGETPFTIVPGEVAAVTVDCKLLSTIATVAYDATIAEKLNEGYKTTIAITDSYDQTAIDKGDVHSLVYTESKDGFFMMPEGSTTLSWRFEGEHPVEGALLAEGVIENVKAAARYTVSLKYSKDADGTLNFTADVDVSLDEHDDTITFSPDPTIMGKGFDVNAEQSSIAAARTYVVSALANIDALTLMKDGATYDLMNNTLEGVSVVKNSDTSYDVTIDGSLFANNNGGESIVTLHVEDADGGKLTKDIVYGVQGIVPITASDYSLWYGNATFSAKVLATNAASVKIAYRVNGGEWKELDATAGADGYYTAQMTEITADKSYDYKLVVDGADSGRTLSLATEVGAQLPNAGFEEWSGEEPYYPYASGASPFWLTGNEGSQMAGTNLTTPSTDVRPGSTGTKSAYLKSTYAAVMGIGKFAAGNLFTGTFSLSGMNGTVGFGRNFAFNAKPKSLSVWMKHNEGTINYGAGTPAEATGNDLCTMMVLITDWQTQRKVDTSNTSTFFTMDDLATMDGVIAYGYYQSRESHKEWSEYTLELTYREDMKNATPRMVVVSFTPSGFGDYFTGSSDSWMYVDDLKFNY